MGFNKVDKIVFVASLATVSIYSIKSNIDLDDKIKRVTPEQVYETNDLNHDTRKDLISESINGYKTPLYAVPQNDGSIKYVSGDAMKITDPTTDYKTIEYMLNKK